MKKSRKYKILVVDDEVDISRVLEFLLIGEGYDVSTAPSGEKALEIFEKKSFDLVLTDFKMNGMTGLDLMNKIKSHSPDTPVLIMTAFASVENAVDAMKAGAADYIVKPFINEDVIMTLKRILTQLGLEDENRTLRRQLSNRMAQSEFIGGSSSISKIFAEIEKVVPTKSNILILGESGTGKSLMAELIHKNSPRRDGPFLAINCSAIPETLLESELFGYKKGAFTGANSNKKGLVESCDSGTLFLDEIGDMPATIQAKVLKVIESAEITPLGDVNPVQVDVRLIAATNHDLEGLVRDGKFREDLYYRLDVIRFTLPPLRERPDDIPSLAMYFLAKLSREHGKHFEVIDDDALDLLLAYPWEGNARELMNVMERAVLMGAGKSIKIADIHRKVKEARQTVTATGNLKDMTAMYERNVIQQRIDECGSNKEEAAGSLGIDLATLYRKMKKLNI